MIIDGILIKKIQEKLNNEILTAKISKIYALSNKDLLLVVRGFKGKNQLLISIDPENYRIQLTYRDYIKPQVASNFAMVLRKHLEGGLITKIKQINNDRIVLVEITNQNEINDQKIKRLYIELMGRHSNVVLCDHEDKIIETMKYLAVYANEYRIIQPGVIYKLPPIVEKLDFFSATKLVENFASEYAGVGKILNKEIIYRLSNHQNLAEIINAFDDRFYLYKNNQGHFLPLTHLGDPVKVFDNVFEGFDYLNFKKLELKQIDASTTHIAKFVANELAKQTKKLKLLKLDLLKADKAETDRENADLLYSNLHLMQTGMKSVLVDDYFTGEKKEIQLLEKLNPKENAKRYINLYTKKRNSVHFLNQEIVKAQDLINYFSLLQAQLETANVKDALEIKEELEKNGFLKAQKTKFKKKTSSKPAFETYLGPHCEILVGKNNIQNNYITFKAANRNDTWLHVKDMPGSHVVIKSEEIDEATIRMAAKLAAYYSKARYSQSIPVDYTLVRNVKKVSNSPLGYVTFGKNKTIFIDIDEEEILNFKKVKKS